MLNNARRAVLIAAATALLPVLLPSGALASGSTSASSAQAPTQPATSPTTPTTPAAVPPGTIEHISDLHSTTYWAYPNGAAVIHAHPRAGAAVARLHATTEDGLDEVYLVLDRMTDAHGTHWLHITIPGRPLGRTGWVLASNLGPLTVNHEHMIINRKSERLTLYKKGQQIFSAPVGVGAPGTLTPAGNFWVREMFGGFNNAAYGPYAIGTSAYSATLTDWPGGGVVGIHGTDQPGLIPGRPSHGCVRLRNGDVTRLYHMLQLGTPITII
jgi:hypothetical protein